MANPILVTGLVGCRQCDSATGRVGRTVTELLLKQEKAVRAMVRKEDERAQVLRDMGADVVVGNLLDLDSMHRVIAGCETMYFSMSVSDDYLEATVNVAAVAKHHGVKAFINMSQITSLKFCRRERIYELRVVIQRDSVGGHGLDRGVSHGTSLNKSVPKKG